ncbi:MAG TPA: porin family protein [Bacteroidales bacterium]|nr:porin family protein [Bacteroidales bacterium]
MKKILFIFILLSVFTTLNAQGLYFGPQIGLSHTSYIEKNSLDETVKQSFKMGYQIGAAAELEIMSFLYVGAAVTFFNKGNKVVDEFGTSRLNLGCIDIPITIGYKVPIGNLSVFGNIGPYTCVAIAGKSIYHSEVMDEEFEHEVEFDPEYGYKRFDSGLTFGGGVDFKQFQVKANYSFGFVDLSSSEFYSMNNSVFNITGTYFIGRNF